MAASCLSSSHEGGNEWSHQLKPWGKMEKKRKSFLLQLSAFPKPIALSEKSRLEKRGAQDVRLMKEPRVEDMHTDTRTHADTMDWIPHMSMCD